MQTFARKDSLESVTYYKTDRSPFRIRANYNGAIMKVNEFIVQCARNDRVCGI